MRFLLLLLPLLSLTSCQDPAAARIRPSVVVLLIDTLRADWLEAYGYPGASSPAIQALAEEAVLFEQASAAAPWTLPSVVSLMTGRLVAEHNVVSDGQILQPGAETLAQKLQARGYRTASFFANPYAGPFSGLDRGFERCERISNGDAASRLAEWIATAQGAPAFVYLHVTQPHNPFRPLPKNVPSRAGVEAAEIEELRLQSKRYRNLTRTDFTQGQTLGTTDNTAQQQRLLDLLTARRDEAAALYTAAVRDADACVEAVVQVLRDAGRLDDTLLVLVADHGEELAERGGWLHDQSVYQELIHVPLLMRLPDAEHAGKRVAAPVSLVDVAPTLLEYVGAEPLAAAGGHSLWPLITGSAPAEPRVTAMRHNQKKYFRPYREQRGDRNVVVREGRWKAIVNLDVDRVELYDLSTDPDEQDDRSLTETELAAELRQVALDYLRAAGPHRLETIQGSLDDLDEGTRERLESLGYLDDGP